MTICPIAIVVGCQKCPAYQVCPLKGVIGNYTNPSQAPDKPSEAKKEQTKNSFD